MKRISIYLFALLLFACQNTTEKKAAEKNANIKEAIYESATVYAAATDFYFKDTEGNKIEFRESNLPGEQKVGLPELMLDPNASEGPPGANPQLVGRTFQLIYDKEGQLKTIKLVGEMPAPEIKYGSSLKLVEQANGGPFGLLGFEIDAPLAGKVVDWKGGKLEGEFVQFRPGVNLPTEEYQQILGDDIYSSEHPMMQKAELKVVLFGE